METFHEEVQQTQNIRIYSKPQLSSLTSYTKRCMDLTVKVTRDQNFNPIAHNLWGDF
jgi:hypothetical protein